MTHATPAAHFLGRTPYGRAAIGRIVSTPELQTANTKMLMRNSKALKMMVGLSSALAMLIAAGCVSTADRSAGRVLDDKLISSKVKKELDGAPVYKFTDVKVNT